MMAWMYLFDDLDAPHARSCETSCFMIDFFANIHFQTKRNNVLLFILSFVEDASDGRVIIIRRVDGTGLTRG